MTRQLRIQQFTRKKPNGISANALTQQVIKVLTLRGWCVWRQNNGAVYDPVKKVFRAGHTLKGVPDVIGFHRQLGTFIGCEIKVGSDKPSFEQELFLSTLNKSGGIGLVVRSIEDLEQIK